MLIVIIFIISLVVATMLTNAAQQFYMKMIGASEMYFSGKKKLIAIFVISLLLTAVAIQIFGIEIPK
jgi:hypothetical protein